MTRDIKPYGSADDITWRWVKTYSGWTGAEFLELIAIDRFGAVVHRTNRTKPMKVGAPTEEEAVTEVLATALTQADADLERRGRDAPEPEPAPEPMDLATRRFLDD